MREGAEAGLARQDEHRALDRVPAAEERGLGGQELTQAQISAVLGAGNDVAAAVAGDGEQRIEAPGQLASHYAPGKPVRLGAAQAAPDEFLIGFGPVSGHVTLSAAGDVAEAAARLYACLHEAAAASQPRVAVAPIPDDGIGAAINDRLRRAAA